MTKELPQKVPFFLLKVNCNWCKQMLCGSCLWQVRDTCVSSFGPLLSTCHHSFAVLCGRDTAVHKQMNSVSVFWGCVPFICYCYSAVLYASSGASYPFRSFVLLVERCYWHVCVCVHAYFKSPFCFVHGVNASLQLKSSCTCGQTAGNIWAPKYYIFPVDDLPHRPP